MGWETSDRHDFLPPNWDAIRLQRLKIDDFRCVMRLPSGARCPRKATDVDHLGDREDHRLEVLRSLCAEHHKRVTQVQAYAGRAKKKPTKRPEERHPGLR